MTSDRRKQISELYHAALSHDSASRTTFLAQACGSDEALLREVESLLELRTLAADSPAPTRAAHNMSDIGPSLAEGHRFGSYQVTGLLGAGGMGEVFHARDTKLGRDVAIKMLPRGLSNDPERIARFEREARLLASLNHPNIGAIYGLEEAEGVRGLVLELIEGDTLGVRIQRGPVPAKEALAIARQIADALDAAHERGIVHRDLKPANIKITPVGVVKVLDFGLAKAVRGEVATPDLAESPTMAAHRTRDGVILGTAAYMSPEQARGVRVDKRTDIWAFGCVLYEMLSGRMAFGRGTISDTIVAILEGEPDWDELRSTPPHLSELIRHCLQKDVNLRLRDIGDARNGLGDDVKSGESLIHATHVSRPFSAVIPWLIAGLAVIALVTLLVTRPALQEPLAAPQISRTTILVPSDQYLDNGSGSYSLALSPDGTRLVYAAAREGTPELYIRSLGELTPTLIPGTKGASNPFFSPDAVWVAFFADGMLQKVAVVGGAPVQVCPVERGVVHGTWAGAGNIVFAVRGSGLFTVPAGGGTPRLVPDSLGSDWPNVLPDGKTVLVTWDGAGIVAMSLDGSNRRVVAFRSDLDDEPGRTPWLKQENTHTPRVLGAGYLLQAKYLPTGHLAYGQSPGVVRAVSFDASSATVRGPSFPLVDSVYQAPGSGAVYFAISDSGLLTYSTENRLRQLVLVDREGTGMPLGDTREPFRFPRLSVDGTKAAVVIDSETRRRSDIWIYDLQRGARTRLTNDEHNLQAVWAPDGTRLFFYRSGQIAVQHVNGEGRPTTVHPGPNVAPESWDPGGHSMLFTDYSSKTGADIWEFLPGEGGRARPMLVTPFSENSAKFSPDGKFVAYVSNESGRSEVYVASYPNLAEKVVVSARGGTMPAWSPGGKELFYRQGLAMMAVQVELVGGRRFQGSTPKVLFSDPSLIGVGGDLSFDVTRDGRRFLMVKGFDASSTQQFVVVHNWFEELKRREPNANK
jgi:serine/threonine protein kinase